MMKGFLTMGATDKCFQVLEMMGTKPDDPLAPTQVTYGILLDACIMQNDAGRMRDVFDRMVSTGCPINKVLYTILIKGFAKAGSLDSAWDIYEQMRSQGVER